MTATQQFTENAESLREVWSKQFPLRIGSLIESLWVDRAVEGVPLEDEEEIWVGSIVWEGVVSSGEQLGGGDIGV